MYFRTEAWEEYLILKSRKRRMENLAAPKYVFIKNVGVNIKKCRNI
jgi:hypothetical protein